MHTRFEHSIGVMHVATLLYDAILRNSTDVLLRLYGDAEEQTWRDRERQKVRLAALLHDVGHAPFSHASEGLFPVKGSDGIGSEKLLFEEMEQKKNRYKHEDYSVALITLEMRDAIENDDFNKRNFGIKASEIADLLEGNPDAGPTLFWKEILSNQLDADRMDYLLRDSHHLGVNYGKYDLHRLASNVCAFEFSTDSNEIRVGIGVLKGGIHAAESLIAARYSMFKQVYFHKTRMAFDIHLQNVMAELLEGKLFPLPNQTGLREYLKWDDWRVQGMLTDGKGGEHAQRMFQRHQFRMIYSSRDRLVKPKDPKKGLDSIIQEEKKLKAVKKSLGGLLAAERTSKNSWYKTEAGEDITVIDENNPSKVQPLSFYSAMAELNAENQHFLYVAPESVAKARPLVQQAIDQFEEQLKQKKAKGKNSKYRQKRKSVSREVKPGLMQRPETTVPEVTEKEKRNAG